MTTIKQIKPLGLRLTALTLSFAIIGFSLPIPSWAQGVGAPPAPAAPGPAAPAAPGTTPGQTSPTGPGVPGQTNPTGPGVPGQTNPTGPGTTPTNPIPPDTTPPGLQPSAPARVNNPLIISSPNGTPTTALKHYGADGQLDTTVNQGALAPSIYPQDPNATQTIPGGVPLPLFGYDYFAPSRQIWLSRRAALQRPGYAPAPFGTLGTNQTYVGPDGQLYPLGTQPGYGQPAYGQPGYSQPGYGQPGTTTQPGVTPGYNQPGVTPGTTPGYGQPGVTPGTTPGYGQPGVTPGFGDQTGTTTQPGITPGFGGQPGTTTQPGMTPGFGGQPGVTSGTTPGYGQPGVTPGTTPGYGQPGVTPGYAPPQDNGPQGGPDVTGSSNDLNANTQIVDPITALFQNVTASLPPSYQLNSGDKLTISFSTPTLPVRTFTAPVDGQGNISLPELGKITIRNLTVTQAESFLTARYARLYRSPTVIITLSEIRTISVVIGGQSFLPGGYNVPATTTFYNLLYATGGPTEDGTLRRIELRRNGRVIEAFDFYKYLQTGGGVANIRLQPGDVIYIPPRFSRVSVTGEVREPAIYELLNGETVRQALRYAGGVRAASASLHVQISTVQPGTARILKDVNLSDQAAVATTVLYDGDTIDVFALRDTFINQVTAEGAVNQPGPYEFTKGMHVSDLITDARGPFMQAYLPTADIYRLKPDNTLEILHVDIAKVLAHDPNSDIALAPYDRLHVYTRQEVAFAGSHEVTIKDAIQREGVYYRFDNMRVRDLLLQAGGPTPEADLSHAELLHQHPDGSFSYETISIRDAMNDVTDKNPLLQDNDIFAVYKIGESSFTANHIVSILGEVTSPGVYPRGDNERLSDLLRYAGGALPGAVTHVTIAHTAKVGTKPDLQIVDADLVRDSAGASIPTPDVALEDGDVVTIQRVGTFQDHIAVASISGLVKNPGPIVINGRMRLSEAIHKAGGLQVGAFPDGVVFTRNPNLLASVEQRSLTYILSQANDVLNNQTYNRDLAVSDIEKIQALTEAQQSNQPIAIPGASAQIIPQVSRAEAAPVLNRDLVSQPRVLGPSDLTVSGNVAIDLRAALRHPGSSDDIFLEDGDTISIPQQPTTIQVVGAVFQARSVEFKTRARAQYYIDRAGGLTPDAAQDRIEIIRAGGGLIPASKVRTLLPGDLILVPTEVQAAQIARNTNNFDNFFRSLTSSAIIYKVVSSLF